MCGLELVDELVGVGVVYRIPQRPRSRLHSFNGCCRESSRWRRGELCGGFCGDGGTEVYELVEGAWDAVEADRLESDFAHKGRVLDGGGWVRRGEVVEESERGRRVDGHCRGCLQ